MGTGRGAVVPMLVLSRDKREAVHAFPGVALDVYRHMARTGATTVSHLSGEIDMSRHQVQAAVAELVSLKLVREGDDGTIVAMPHSQALDDLLAEQAMLLTNALQHVSDGQRRLRVLVENRSMLDPAEAERISTTAMGDAADKGMFELPGQAKEALSAIHPGGSFDEALLRRSLARAEECIDKNVRMRVIHQTSVLRHPGMVAYLEQLASLGCRVRLRDNLPFRLLLIDASAAVCAVPTSGSFFFKGERVMVLLNRVFETTWVDAIPLDRATARVDATSVPRQAQEYAGAPARLALDSGQEAILRFLAEGQTDQAIARALGITTRTVTRRMSEIYEALGVQSRFQAGIAAKSIGIV